MKLIAISDLHGNLPEIKENADIMIIAGDISPLNIQGNKPKMIKWLKTTFIDWINSLNVEKVHLIAGNHDWVFENCSDSLIVELHMLSNSKLVYLCNQETEYYDSEGKKWRIFGTPYCRQFGNWAFMRDDNTLEEIYKAIPKDIDILISHDAPYGCSDICFENVYWRGEHIGCVPLRDIILEKSPKMVFHGHLHSSNHEIEMLGKSEIVNCSLLNENYELGYDPLVIEVKNE